MLCTEWINKYLGELFFPAHLALNMPWSYGKGFKTNKTNYDKSNNSEDKDKPSSLLMLSLLRLAFKCPNSCAHSELPANQN